MVEENKLLLVIKRDEPQPHYELHFDKRVEFWTMDGKKLGISKVEVYSYYQSKEEGKNGEVSV